MHPKLIIEQKITAFVNKYAVYGANPDGSKAELKAFVQQKRFAFKEMVSFYSDTSKTQLLFTFRAEKVLDVHGRYFVEDADGQLIGSFRKQFGKSLLNSTWSILGPDDQPQFTVRESNQFLAIFRRICGFIPYVGNLAEIIILFFRYHFVFLDNNGTEQGRYKKTTLIRDHYLLSTTDEVDQSTDWRILAAMAVALDALQSR